MLGAVSDDGDRFITLTPNQFNAEIAKHFLRAIRHEFSEKFAIVLDNASHFIAKTLKKQAAGVISTTFEPFQNTAGRLW